MTAGHVHSVGFPTSATELRALMTPFLAADGPVIVVQDDRTAGLIRSWAPDPAAVSFLSPESVHRSPAGAIATCTRLFDMHLAKGATRIRLTGPVPADTGWERYEAAINTLWDEYPLDTLCVHTPGSRSVAERTHPHLCTAAGTVDNPAYDPGFTALPPVADPLESSAPTVLADPTPAEARHAVTTMTTLPTAATDDLVFGVSEAVTNALLHGKPPVTVRLWAAPARMVVHVTDGGSGPDDPFTGLVPARREHGGLGLWLAHQLDVDVALIPGPRSFTLRLRAGERG